MMQPYLGVSIVIISIYILQVFYDAQKRYLSYKRWVDKLKLAFCVEECRLFDRVSNLVWVSDCSEIMDVIEPLLWNANSKYSAIRYATISTMRTPEELRRIGATAEMLVDLPELFYEMQVRLVLGNIDERLSEWFEMAMKKDQHKLFVVHVYDIEDGRTLVYEDFFYIKNAVYIKEDDKEDE